MRSQRPGRDSRRTRVRAVLEVFGAFLRLGLTSFGGPVAHLGYFREVFVVRSRWLSEKAYADIVALCQFIPGPASSQVGMAIGLQRAGYGGLLAAWVGFTLPSALVMVAFGYGVSSFDDPGSSGWLIGFKAAAVAVVAHAVIGMGKTLTPDLPRLAIAGAALGGSLLAANAGAQIIVITAAGVLGWLCLQPDTTPPSPDDDLTIRVRRGTAFGCLAAFLGLLVALPISASLTDHDGLGLVDVFYRAGALVFGGGHVVLPLLHAGVVESGLIEHDQFLAGYGAAQAVPGPLFTFSAYLGTINSGEPSGILGAVVALGAIFLPSALLVIGVLPYWMRLRHHPTARLVMAGLNAGVVGLLAAALYDPVFVTGITSAATLVLAAVAFLALSRWAVPPWAVVVGCGVVGQIVW